MSRLTTTSAAGAALLIGGCGVNGAGLNTALPPAALKASTTSVSFSSGPAANLAPATVVLSESNYSGAFNESDTCGSAGIAAVSPTNAVGPTAVFSVVAQNAGTCAVRFSDDSGQKALVAVSVTTTALGIQ